MHWIHYIYGDLSPNGMNWQLAPNVCHILYLWKISISLFSEHCVHLHPRESFTDHWLSCIVIESQWKRSFRSCGSHGSPPPASGSPVACATNHSVTIFGRLFQRRSVPRLLSPDSLRDLKPESALYSTTAEVCDSAERGPKQRSVRTDSGLITSTSARTRPTLQFTINSGHSSGIRTHHQSSSTSTHPTDPFGSDRNAAPVRWSGGAALWLQHVVNSLDQSSVSTLVSNIWWLTEQLIYWWLVLLVRFS